MGLTTALALTRFRLRLLVRRGGSLSCRGALGLLVLSLFVPGAFLLFGRGTVSCTIVSLLCMELLRSGEVTMLKGLLTDFCTLIDLHDKLSHPVDEVCVDVRSFTLRLPARESGVETGPEDLDLLHLCSLGFVHGRTPMDVRVFKAISHGTKACLRYDRMRVHIGAGFHQVVGGYDVHIHHQLDEVENESTAVRRGFLGHVFQVH